MHDQVKDLAESVSRKAESERVWELGEKFHEYAKLDTVTKIEKDLMMLIGRQEFEEYKLEVKGKFSYVKVIMDTFAKKDDTESKIK